MTWRVNERYLVGKVDLATCEDVLVASQHRFAVVDGATDKSGLTYQWQGRTVSSGRFAAEVVADALTRLPALAPIELVTACSQALKDAIASQRPGLPAEALPGASVVAFEVASEQLWFVGDAKAAWVGADGNVCEHSPTKLVDTIAAGFRAAMHEALKAAGQEWDGTGPDPGREAILPLLRVQGALANTSGPLGYAVLNGTPVPDSMVEVVSVPGAVALVLASDGYPSLAPRGRLSLSDAEEHLQRGLFEDPRCLSVLQSTKGLTAGQVSFDDRAWLHLSRA